MNFRVIFYIYLLLQLFLLLIIAGIDANQSKTMNFILIVGRSKFLSKNFSISESS